MGYDYKTPEGKVVKVICYDEPNNMAYFDLGEGEKRWVAKMDYEKWEKVYYHIPDMPAQMSEEQEVKIESEIQAKYDRIARKKELKFEKTK